MNHALKCRYEIKWSYAPRSYERNFSNCVEKTGKFRTSTRFEPVTLLRRCGALSIWATKPQMVGAGHLTVQMFPWWMDQWTKCNKWWIIYWTADMKSSEAMILELLLSCSTRYFTRSLRHLSFSTLLSLESYGNIDCDKNNWPIINTSLVYDLQIHKWYFSRHLYTSAK